MKNVIIARNELANADLNEMKSFKAGFEVIVFENFINTPDQYLDEVITFNKYGMLNHVRVSGCGNCDTHFHFSDTEKFAGIAHLLQGNEKLAKFMVALNNPTLFCQNVPTNDTNNIYSLSENHALVTAHKNEHRVLFSSAMKNGMSDAVALSHADDVLFSKYVTDAAK